MKKLSFDAYCFSERNHGLGHNQNKGIIAARGEYLLQVQDDWFLHGPGDFVQVAIQAFDVCPHLGFIRLWHHPGLVRPSVRLKMRSGIVVRVFEGTAHPERPPDNEYLYSDRPHIKRRQYHHKLGLYREDLRMNAMETEFCMRFERQRDIATGVLEGYEQLFEHIGTEQSFNPSQKRANWRAKLERHWFLRYPWRIYVRLRYGRPR
jgi:glycosyltransferase involved in cell wall biosynthesis